VSRASRSMSGWRSTTRGDLSISSTSS